MVIIFECNQTICKCSMLAAGMQCQKHFHLNMNHRTPVFACSHSHSYTCIHTHTYTHFIHTECSMCIASVRMYTMCMVWLLSDTLCDSNAGECDFIHMPSKWMVGFFIVAVFASAAAAAAFSFRAFIRQSVDKNHYVTRSMQ